MKIHKSFLDKNGEPCCEVVSFMDEGERVYMVDVLYNGQDYAYSELDTALDVAQAHTNRRNRSI